MKHQKLKVAMIGLGEQGTDNLLPALMLSGIARVVALCDIDQKRLKKAGNENNITGLYTDYRDMIRTAKPDAIVVSSFPEVHYEVSKFAIENRVAVFVEKPPVSNSAQLTELVALSRIHNVQTGVGMNFSYTDCNNTVRQIVARKEFGEISTVSIEHISSKPTTPLWQFDSLLDSFLLAQLIHPLDYLLSFGGKYNSINVYSTFDAFMNVQVVIEFENGIIGTVKCGTFSPRFRHHIEIISKNCNTLVVRDLTNIEVIQKQGGYPFGLKEKNCSVLIKPSPLKSGYSRSGYSNELDAFFRNILFKEAYAHSFADMISVYTALDYISDSIKARKAEDVNNSSNNPVILMYPDRVAGIELR